ncbi:RNA-binding KH domain-containing protein RCF3-like isoform X2 [Curcuma longa]|uniref:RNA-binding KH domain-containing protein RCF3-like isoform X2 n=1 Tax=Curcuma longa TaxID=136217 RepID=UPI003D9F21EA
MAGRRNNNGKRSYSHSDHSENGGSKRRNPGEERDTYIPGHEDTVFRYLCPGKKIGSIIGRGGEIVKQLRSDTQAKIRIGESVRGCDERVITIFSTREETNTLEDSDDKMCPAQDALFKVHERLVTDEVMAEEDNDGDSPQVTARLLVPSDQIGSIIGKGGQIIQGIRSDTGAQVRILKNDRLPACAVSGDELLQISGEASVVKKALRQVSSRLHDNPSRLHHLLFASSPSVFPGASQFGVSSSAGPLIGIGPLVGSYRGYKGEAPVDWLYPPSRDEGAAKEFSLRLLCPSASIGSVIGKNGVIINQIRQESGASIKVDSNSVEDDCIITISAKEFFDDPISPTIDAAVRLQPRCSEKSEKESGELSYTTRLLVSTLQIGCLIGKAGSIISEMRRATRANIRVLSKENVPKVASEDDEMVQISGEIDIARDALVHVTTRLKANLFERDSTSAAHGSSAPHHRFPVNASDGPKYHGGRDSKSHGRGFSYSGGYGASRNLLPSDTYAGYGSSQGGGSNYSSYDGYSSSYLVPTDPTGNIMIIKTSVSRTNSLGLRSLEPAYI